MVGVAQMVRAPDCDSGGRGFDSHHPPQFLQKRYEALFLWPNISFKKAGAMLRLFVCVIFNWAMHSAAGQS